MALALLAASCLTSSGTSEDTIPFFEERTARDPDDFLALNQLAERYLQRLRETGDLSWLGKAHHAVEQSLRVMPERNLGALALMARVQLGRHRFAESAECARRLRDLGAEPALNAMLLGDALLELGDLEGARAAFAQLKEAAPDEVQTHARLARLAIVTGDAGAARTQLTRAFELARKLTPPAPETVAWCAVRRGEFAFSRGGWDAAEKDYRTALQALPDYYAAIDHMAELHGVRRHFDKAIALYDRLIERLPRPEYFEAMSDLLLAAGRQEEAKNWRERALAAYRESIAQGEVMFVHHLAELLANDPATAPEAVEFARRDLELRQTSAAHELLAWALFRAGDVPAAAAEIEKALARGGMTAHLADRAGHIFRAAGDRDRARQMSRAAHRINPRYHGFHVHR